MRGARALAVLLVTHVVQPVDHLAVELLLDGEMGQSLLVVAPALLSRCAPDPVSRVNLLDRTALSLKSLVLDRNGHRFDQVVRWVALKRS